MSCMQPGKQSWLLSIILQCNFTDLLKRKPFSSNQQGNTHKTLWSQKWNCILRLAAGYTRKLPTELPIWYCLSDRRRIYSHFIQVTQGRKWGIQMEKCWQCFFKVLENETSPSCVHCQGEMAKIQALSNWRNPTRQDRWLLSNNIKNNTLFKS